MKVKGNAFSTDKGLEGEDLELYLKTILDRRVEQEMGPLNGFFNLHRSCDPSDQLDVDLTILDFTVFKAIDSILNPVNDPTKLVESLEMPGVKIEMAHDWINWVARSHGVDVVPAEMGSRIKLLEFVLLFTQRLEREPKVTTAASLEKVRKTNKTRGAFMNSYDSFKSRLPPVSFDPATEFPLPSRELHSNRIRLALDLGVADTDLDAWATDYYGTSACPSLYDIMPDFFRLTAARAEIDWTATDRWRVLAGEWMLQAVVEAYLMYGESGEDLFREIFAFGLPPRDVTSLDDLDDEAAKEAIKAMQVLFSDADNPAEENAHWASVREGYLAALTPDDSSTIISAHTMEIARSKFKMKGFHRNVRGFLTSLHLGMRTPDLVQVERGRIENVSAEESREMLENMGVRRRLTDDEAAEESNEIFRRAGITRVLDETAAMWGIKDAMEE